MKSNEAAVDAYAQRMAEITLAMEEIRGAMTDRVDPDEVSWDHVGTLAYVSDTVKNLADMLLDRGEYAR